MKPFVAFLFSICLSGQLLAQPKGLKSKILFNNKAIDEGIVTKNAIALDTLYADDFNFTHGTGFVDSKKSWLENVAKKEQVFVSRVHDSTSVEMHPDLAIVMGKLTISRKDNEKHVNYGLWYVRVFAPRGKYWQLVSHRTTKEWYF
jgi:hypothetical protein